MWGCAGSPGSWSGAQKPRATWIKSLTGVAGWSTCALPSCATGNPADGSDSTGHTTPQPSGCNGPFKPTELSIMHHDHRKCITVGGREHLYTRFVSSEACNSPSEHAWGPGEMAACCVAAKMTTTSTDAAKSCFCTVVSDYSLVINGFITSNQDAVCVQSDCIAGTSLLVVSKEF